MKMGDVVEGLQILMKYWPDEILNAEHDQIWAGSYFKDGINPLTTEERNRMVEIGWWIDEEHNCYSTFC